MGIPERQESDEKTPVPTPRCLSSQVDVWKALTDKYMKYVTMWFTAATLAFVFFSFCIKTLIVDQTCFLSKVVTGITACIMALLACAICCIVRPRVYSFAEHIVAIETSLSEEGGFAGFFKPLPGRPMMKLLLDFSLLVSVIILFITVLIMRLLFTDPAIFS